MSSGVQGIYRLGVIFLWTQAVVETENDSCTHWTEGQLAGTVLDCCQGSALGDCRVCKGFDNWCYQHFLIHICSEVIGWPR